jgi:uncharacterized protein (TIGR03083 family)
MSAIEIIAEERRRVADVVAGLDSEQLATPSSCGDWTVHEVAGHLLWPLITPLRVVIATAVLARGNFDRTNDRLTRAFAKHPAGEIATGLRTHAESRFHPPGFGLEAPITELLVHGQDLRRPLGLSWTFPPDGLVISLDLLVSPKARRAFVPRGRLAGLAFEATDVDWTGGERGGALVQGPGASLAHAMSGRPAALDELSGPGVAVLRSAISRGE